MDQNVKINLKISGHLVKRITLYPKYVPTPTIVNPANF